MLTPEQREALAGAIDRAMATTVRTSTSLGRRRGPMSHDVTTEHACEVYAETGKCPHLTIGHVMSGLIEGFEKLDAIFGSFPEWVKAKSSAQQDNFRRCA